MIDVALTTEQERSQSANATTEKQKELIASLEADLLRVNALERTAGEGADAVDGESPESPTELIANAFGGGGGAFTKSSLSHAADDASLLPIVASQRERFRRRVQQLEEEALEHQQQMALLQSEGDRMRDDNVKLYEKIKFLQSYRNTSNDAAANLPTTLRDETVERYSGEYEASLDPFRRFNVQERQRSYAQLTAHDKATLNISRWIMTNSQTRAIFFFYLLLLHLLVFLVLYKLASVESCKRDFAQDCQKKFQEHMANVHGSH